MAKYRNALPQLSDRPFVTDGGLETTLIFLDGLDLPHFAAFVLQQQLEGRRTLEKYYQAYISLARQYGVGLILETPTWRANPDWGNQLGYGAAALYDINQDAIALLQTLREEAHANQPIIISGCIGPRGDGYNLKTQMTAASAEQYHRPQLHALSLANADMASALTMTYAAEAIGIVQAAQAVGLPVVISFTVETDGRLPSGQSLGDAISQVDAETANGPAYYMVNCAHPTHFAATLMTNEPWIQRIRGVRVNASTKSHTELDEAEILDDGNPIQLGQQCLKMSQHLPNLNILGGCCGTDLRHIDAICRAGQAVAWSHLTSKLLTV